MVQKILLPTLLLCLAQLAFAQNAMLRGKVTDSENNAPIADASVTLRGTVYVAATEVDGTFEFPNLKPGRYTVVLSAVGYLPQEQAVDIKADVSMSGSAETKNIEVALQRDQAPRDEIVAPNATAAPVPPAELPTVTLDEAESETEGAGDVANLLHASRDVFQTMSGFGWFAFRYRERGYDGGNFYTLLNGVPFNDLETGQTFFGEFGGLNDVLRFRNSTVGMDPAEFAFSEIGGATLIDTRASVQRKQIRASYAISNRTYRHRAMVTASTGLMPGGWAFTLSASRRWAQEGYVPGTFFDGYSYFLSADKKFGLKHTLNLTVLGAPTKRGRTADSYQEMFDIAGTNFYNPLWGYQNGEKRNAQTTQNHQPTAILRYDWKSGEKTNLTVAVYGQTGTNGFSRLNWFNGTNPAPDFNRRLPLSLPDTSQARLWAAELARDESLRQIDWHALYEANRHSNYDVVQNANGTAGNTVSGNRSVYIIENQRSDASEAGANMFFTHSFTSRFLINGGATYQWYKGRNFKVIDDLLGGDFWVDRDFFSSISGQTGLAGGDNDTRIPNHIIREGDIFGYNYNEYIGRTNAWAQGQFSLRRFQGFVGLEAGRTTLQREGLMQNGRFPNQSLGKSEQLAFTTYGVKGGLTYKLNGRNYLYANAYQGTRAPQFRNAFVQPRLRNKVVPNLEMSTIRSVEGGYLIRAPRFRARITAYLTDFLDETENIFISAQTGGRVLRNAQVVSLDENADAYLEVPIFFGAGVLQNVNRRHMGVEAGAEFRLTPAWILSGATSIGRYQYTSRPDMLIAIDNGFSGFVSPGQVYQKNFYVPRTPQTTGSIAIKHENKRFWFASLTLNFMDNLWYDFDRARRTGAFTLGLDNNSPLWRTIVDQQKAPAAFTLDFFGGKSWRLYNGKYFLYLNAGVNNILNDKNIIVSGRESYYNAYRNQYNEDPRFYSHELIYGFGANYFISVAIRM